MVVDGVEKLLSKWEEVYKKGLLSFWLLLFLDGKPSYAYEISRELGGFTVGSLTADENSIYRALNRFEAMGIIQSEVVGSDLGPDRKYYSLTEMGRKLLKQFILRNVSVFEEPTVKARIQSAAE